MRDWVTPGAAPTRILHGTDNKYVAYEQGLWMRDRLQECGVHVEMLTLKADGHGFKGADAEKAESAMFPLLDSQLKNAGSESKMKVRRDIPYAESAAS